MSRPLKILLVEPSYRSKFPPLGLMRLATYHRGKGDRIAFVRGNNNWARVRRWDRIYVSSLFTWELPRTTDTVDFYTASVGRPGDVFVGGVGATLLPQYIRDRSDCTVLEGPLDEPGKLGRGSPSIADLVPDYNILKRVRYEYRPKDAFFVRLTKGCIRSCKFCAVPLLEKDFGKLSAFNSQIESARSSFGEKQHLVVMDNNILGISGIEEIVSQIRSSGFEAGAKRNGKRRTVDFNQGLDARLIAARPELAKLLGTMCTEPIRLAFDFIGIRAAYRKAVEVLTNEGFSDFTNYMLFNFNDTPRDLFERIWLNARLNQELKIEITGFPMRFIPMNDVNRRHVAAGWEWRYLRGFQCILLATKGMISPNPGFISFAFGETLDEFLEILSMPDRYIIYRREYETIGATSDWRFLFRRLNDDQRVTLLRLLEELNYAGAQRASAVMKVDKAFRQIVEHYYPKGRTAPRSPREELLAQQGVSVGYDSGPS